MGGRIEIEQSDRHVEVSYNGVVLAETRRPVLLHERGLPTRYYIPPSDVRPELLRPSDTHTTCPFKGEASYKSVVVNGETLTDFVWFYPEPIPEAKEIAGLYCFYNDKVRIEIDGEPWS